MLKLKIPQIYYMISEALNKNLLSEAYKSILFPQKHNLNDLNFYSLENINAVKKVLTNEVTSRYIKTPELESQNKSSLLIKPAIDYINLHRNEFLLLPEAAQLCHISTSYFSRIFFKVTNENYSTFVSKLKVTWAKQLLEKTDTSIADISNELGFNNPSYFITIFKKHEQLTPNLYRKYYRE